MKTLLYIPIVHNQADLGSLGSQLSAEGESKYGTSRWQNHLEQVDRSWEEIEKEIYARLEYIPYEKIRIYQDGLPIAGEIGIKIVKDAAEKGSKNYQIVESLFSKGALLEIAENKELLLKEYSMLSEISKADTTEKQVEAYINYQNVSQELLNSRDNYISNQINQTLKDDETGIAFFGAAHSVINKLDKDIHIVPLEMFKDVISLNLSKNKK